jgi:DNA polymerase-3 subunit delta
MEIKGRSIDGFLNAPPAPILGVLIHGEDSGLVRERADQIAHKIVPDKADPFRLVDVDAGDLVSDPTRLSDEAAAIAMLGGRRVIRVRRAGDNLAPLFTAFFKSPIGDALFVLEAGVLPKRSTLRQAFENADRAAAIACYGDNDAQVEDLIQSTLRARSLSLEPGAMELLVRNLGGDRLASRGELDKLLLYLGPEARMVTRADVLACASDTTETDSDEIVDAACDGDAPKLDRLLAKAFATHTSPVMLVRAAQSHITRLHFLTAQAQRGGSIEGLVRGLKPGLPYPRQERVIRQARNLSAPALGDMIQMLNEAEIGCKTTGLPDEAVAARALMAIALKARRR